MNRETTPPLDVLMAAGLYLLYLMSGTGWRAGRRCTEPPVHTATY